MIFTADGRQVASAMATAGSTVALRDLPRNQILLVKSGKQTTKVVM